MAVKYDMFKEPSLTNEGEEKYSARVADIESMDFEELLKKAAGSYSGREAQIEASWSDLLSAVRRSLQEGKSVHLKGLGYFHVSCKSRKVTDPQKIRSESVSYKGLIFREDKDFGRKLGSLDFVRTHVRTSVKISDEEILARLDKYFASGHNYIDRRGFAGLCGLSFAMANRKLQQLEKDGKLYRPGRRTSGLYFKKTADLE